ncbi:MAG: phage tail tape measure C-terminal domain-containing protein [Rickettsiales bacterium]
MATSTQLLSIRIAVVDGDKARRELTLTGEQGQRALARIQEASKPASRELAGFNVVGEQVRFGMEHLAEGSGSLGTSLVRLGPAGLAAAAVIGTLGLAVTEGLKEFKAAEQALNSLNAALKATDSSSGITASTIEKLGESVEKNTLFKKTDILQAAAALTSFNNVAGDTFTRALKLSTDLAVRLGTDVPSAADLLGKSLESPEEGLGRLARKFSDLSPAQKDVIANFVKSGDLASAQAVILSHLEEKTRGLAEAQTNGLTGSTNELNDAWNQLLESFGRTVSESGIAQASLRGLTSVVQGLREAIDPTRSERKTQLEKDIASMEDSFGTRLDKAVLGSAPSLDAKKEELRKINAELAVEQQAAVDEQNKAAEAASKAAAERRNGQLLELQKKFLKESEDLTLSSRQKILKESAERRQDIIALNGGDENSDAAKKALAALNSATRAKLADAGRNVKEDPDVKRRDSAINEINKGILQTKPSFDVAKAALDDWKARVIDDLGGATDANQKYIDLIEQIYTVKLKDIYNKSLLDSSKWENGAIRGLRRYADEATNAAKNAEELFSGAASKVEDTLVDMVSSGEFSVKKIGDLLQSLQQDILRSFLRESVTGPIAKGLGDLLGGGSGGSSSGGGGLSGFFGNLFGGSSSSGSSGGGFFGNIFSSFFHQGGVVGESLATRREMPAYLFHNAPRFHSGLMPDEFPAILQKGETVIPKGKSMGMAGMNVTFNVNTPNAQSFMDSQGQVMAKMAGSLQRYKTRNG